MVTWFKPFRDKDVMDLVCLENRYKDKYLIPLVLESGKVFLNDKVLLYKLFDDETGNESHNLFLEKKELVVITPIRDDHSEFFLSMNLLASRCNFAM